MNRRVAALFQRKLDPLVTNQPKCQNLPLHNIHTAAPIVAKLLSPFFPVECIISQQSTLPLSKPLLLRSVGLAQPPRRLSDHLHRSTADRKRRKTFWKGGQNEKNCSSTSPRTRALWLNLESAGQSRTPPSAPALSQHKTMQEHATSPADWWEGGRGNRKCVWWGRGSDLVGGREKPPSQFRWCYLMNATMHCVSQTFKSTKDFGSSKIRSLKGNLQVKGVIYMLIRRCYMLLNVIFGYTDTKKEALFLWLTSFCF